jgi:hypothetical protein
MGTLTIVTIPNVCSHETPRNPIATQSGQRGVIQILSANVG